jgi:hypothetical protein
VAVAGHDYSESARRAAADRGEALTDGSYPIRSCEELDDAIDAYGRAPDQHRAALRALIRRRNEDLHCGRHLDRLEHE